MRWLALLFSLTLTTATLADGKVFPRILGSTTARIPDQQALISYSDGVEVLVIETRVEASGAELAWVVPTPTRPEVSAGTTGTFPTLRAIVSPRLRDLGGAGLVLGLNCLLMVVALEFLLFKQRKSWGGPGVLLVVLLLILLGCFALLPSLGKARGGAAEPTAGVEVLERNVVGSYDVAVLAASDAGLLITWLTTNGFAVPREDEPTIAAYVKEGWCFTASRLRRPDSTSPVLTPHPLVLKFPTPTPVYPMRLTAHGMDDALELDLYVFGPGTASASGMRVITTDAVIRVPSTGAPSRDVYEVAHATLNELTANATHLTLLRGVIPRESITGDLKIGFDVARSKRPWVVSHGTAHLVSAAVASCVALVGMVGSLIRFKGAAPREKRATMFLTLLLVTIGGYAGTLWAMPSVDTVSGRAPWRESHRVKQGAQVALFFTDSSESQERRPATLAEARRRVADFFADERVETSEGDGPGQYRLEQRDDDIDLVYVDHYGREQREWAGTLEPSGAADLVESPTSTSVGRPTSSR